MENTSLPQIQTEVFNPNQIQQNAYPLQNPQVVYTTNFYGAPQQNMYSVQSVMQNQPIVQEQTNTLPYMPQPIIQNQPIIQAQPFAQVQPDQYPYAVQPMTQMQPIVQQSYGVQPQQGQQITITLNHGVPQAEQNQQDLNQGLNPIQTDIDNQWKYQVNNDDMNKSIDKSGYSDRPFQNNDENKNSVELKPQPESSLGLTKKVSSSRHSCCQNITLNIIFCFTFLIGILATLIALMAFHFGNKELKLTSASGALEYIAQNINSNPIMEIRLENSGVSCPTGYEKLKIGRWPGSKIGCNCGNSNVKSGYCSDKDRSCSTVFGIDPFDLYNWQLSDWCIKRAISETEFVRAATCPSNFRPCSAGVCIVETSVCPITNLTLSFTNISGNSGQFADTSDGRYLIHARVEGEEPVISITTSLNDLPCFSNNEYPEGSQNYPLIDQTVSGCQRYGVDNQFSHMIDFQNQDVFMSDNQANVKIFDLPGYSQVMQATRALLVQRNRISVANKEECLNLDVEIIEKSAKAADKMNLTITVTSILGMCLYVALIFLFIVAVSQRSKKGHSWSDFFKGQEGSRIWLVSFTLIGIVHTILYIAMFALTRHYLSKLTQAEDYFDFLDQNSCFTIAQPPQVVTDYPILIQSVAHKLYKYSIALITISLSTVVPNVLCLIFA